MGNLRPDLSAHARTDKVEQTGGDEMEDEDDVDTTAAKATPARTAAASTNASQAKVAAANTNPGALVLKGVTLNAAQPFAMISDGTRAYTVGKGETFTVTLPQGRVTLRCEDITKDSVVVKPTQGEAIVLHLH
jgi:hypothetical protein